MGGEAAKGYSPSVFAQFSIPPAGRNEATGTSQHVASNAFEGEAAKGYSSPGLARFSNPPLVIRCLAQRSEGTFWASRRALVGPSAWPPALTAPCGMTLSMIDSGHVHRYGDLRVRHVLPTAPSEEPK